MNEWRRMNEVLALQNWPTAWCQVCARMGLNPDVRILPPDDEDCFLVCH